ncbi:MAG: hypothetical protein AAGD22_17615, partial [Verrucomicrobiota bacterium]
KNVAIPKIIPLTIGTYPPPYRPHPTQHDSGPKHRHPNPEILHPDDATLPNKNFNPVRIPSVL